MAVAVVANLIHVFVFIFLSPSACPYPCSTSATKVGHGVCVTKHTSRLMGTKSVRATTFSLAVTRVALISAAPARLGTPVARGRATSALDRTTA